MEGITGGFLELRPTAPGLLFGVASRSSSDLYRDLGHPLDLDGRTGLRCRILSWRQFALDGESSIAAIAILVY